MLAAMVAIMGVAGVSRAALYDPGFTGNVKTAQWTNLGTNGGWASNGFGSSVNWALSPNIGTGVTIQKTSGYAEMATGSIYYSFGSDPFDFTSANTQLVVVDTSPVSGLTTVLLQFEIGNNGTATFYNGVLPRLSYNGGSQEISASVVTTNQVGTVDFGAFTGTIVDYALEFDVGPMGVSSYAIDWTGVDHDTIYAVRVDETDAPTVPEPATASLVGVAAVAVGLRRR